MSANPSSLTVTVNVGALSNALAVAIQLVTDRRGAILNAGIGGVSTLKPSSSVFFLGRLPQTRVHRQPTLSKNGRACGEGST